MSTTPVIRTNPAIAPAPFPRDLYEEQMRDIRDDAVVRQLQNAMGQRVQISYQQHVGIPTSCFGETEYFATKAHTGPVNPVAPSEAPAQ